MQQIVAIKVAMREANMLIFGHRNDQCYQALQRKFLRLHFATAQYVFGSVQGHRIFKPRDHDLGFLCRETWGYHGSVA